MDRTVTPSRTLGFTQLYLDFLAGHDPAKGFYSSSALDQIAERLDALEYDRTPIVEILRQQNQSFHSSKLAFSNIERLADRRAVCICAGQQAGLFGGPMLSLIKGLAIAKAAPILSERLRRPVIPIFWIAGDDHDFAEVNHTVILDKAGEPHKVEYSTAPDSAPPVGNVQFSDSAALSSAVTSLREGLGDSDFTPDLYRLIEECYTPDDTFVTAFGKFMAALTAEFGLVFFSPYDSRAKQLSLPFFEAVLDKQDAIINLLGKRNREITDAGYHLQVQKNEQATHLFLEIDGRKPIHRDGSQFKVGERAFSREELLSMLESDPQRFSPDALTRPLLQSQLFPVLAQMGGPSEIAYFAQGNALFDLFKRPMPHHIARPSVVLLEKRFGKLIEEFNIRFDEMAGDIEQLVNRVLATGFPPDLEENYNQLRTDIQQKFDQFSTQSLAFDPSLKDFAKQTFGKIEYSLKNFEEKLFASHKKKSKETREKIYRLRNAVYPNGAMQDRSLNVSYFIAKHGTGIIPFLFENLNPFESAAVIAPLSEMER